MSLPKACYYCGATPDRVKAGADPVECWERNIAFTNRGTFYDPGAHLFVTIGGKCRECGADNDNGKPIRHGWCARCFVENKS